MRLASTPSNCILTISMKVQILGVGADLRQKSTDLGLKEQIWGEKRRFWGKRR